MTMRAAGPHCDRGNDNEEQDAHVLERYIHRRGTGKEYVIDKKVARAEQKYRDHEICNWRAEVGDQLFVKNGNGAVHAATSLPGAPLT